MAKKAKKEIIKEEDLLGSDSSNCTPPQEEQPYVEPSKNKVLLGYHPITGAEVWQ